MNSGALVTGLGWPPRLPCSSRSPPQDRKLSRFLSGKQIPLFVASSCSRSPRRSFYRHRRRNFCVDSFAAFRQPERLVAVAASVASDSGPSENRGDGTLFLHVLDEHLALARQREQQGLHVPEENEIEEKGVGGTENSGHVASSFHGTLSELQHEGISHVLECKKAEHESCETPGTGSEFVMTDCGRNAEFENLNLSRGEVDLENGFSAGFLTEDPWPVHGTEQRENEANISSGGESSSTEEFELLRPVNCLSDADRSDDDKMSCSEFTRADVGADLELEPLSTSSSDALRDRIGREILSGVVAEDRNAELGVSQDMGSLGLGNQFDTSLAAKLRLRIGRQLYLTGERDFSRWMPNGEERPGEERAADEITADSVELPVESIELPVDSMELPVDSMELPFDSMELPVDSSEESLAPRELESFSISNESPKTSRTEADKGEDLFLEFLRKRRELWGGNAYAGVKVGKHGGDAQAEVLANITPEPTSRSIDLDWKAAGVESHGSRTEPLSESEKQQTVEAATEDLSKTLCSEWTDETHRREAVAQGVVRIARVLPVNASLETYLTQFAGKIGTEEGNLVLKVLGEAYLPWPMLSFFQWMRVHKPNLLDSRSFSALFSQLGRSGMGDQAFLQYQNMPDDPVFHCVQVYNSLIGGLAKSGRHGKIPLLLKQMDERHIERDHFTYCILLAATRRHGDERADEVWSIFDEMLQAGLKPSVPVYGALVKAFCDERHLKQALLVSVSMEKSGLSPNVMIYNMLIDAHGKSGLLEEAEGLLVEMRQRGLSPTNSTYNSLINAYGKAGQLDAAEELVSEMPSQGIKPDVVTYTALISAYGKQKQSEKAASVFLKMRRKGILPTTYSYTALINAYAEGGWHDKAQRAFDDMKVMGLKPTVETYTALLDAYRRAGHLDMVRYLWSAIKEDGCELTRVTYRTIVDAFGKHGFYVEAREVIDEFRKYGIQPDTMIFNILLQAYSRAGVQTKLPKVYKEMHDAGCEPDCYTYCTLIYAYIRIRDYTRAFEYESEMLGKDLVPPPKVYRKMKFILDGKYALKLENDKKANAGQESNGGEKKSKSRNRQRSKHRKFKQFVVRGPHRGSERAKALWKSKEIGSSR